MATVAFAVASVAACVAFYPNPPIIEEYLNAPVNGCFNKLIYGVVVLTAPCKDGLYMSASFDISYPCCIEGVPILKLSLF
nr:MAG TPA: hypothetical protein [Crassvirales sp.]